jgi:hypothetical protein
MIRMSLALLVFVQHNVLLATSFKKRAERGMEKKFVYCPYLYGLSPRWNLYGKDSKFLGDEIRGLSHEFQKKKNLNMPDLGVIDELDSTKERNKSFS